MHFAPGVHLGPYELLEPLSAGGMGQVYKARDTRLDRLVAIKTQLPHFSAVPEFRERFEHEARAVAALKHQHICSLYDIGHQDGLDYLVMEFVEGETLAQRLKPEFRRSTKPSAAFLKSQRHWTTRTATEWCTVTSNRRTS